MKYLSLFSGIGAFEKALSNIGIDYELVGFSEIDKYAIKSYCAIHGVDENLNLGDITKINIDKLPTDIDLITHGSPCQDYSVAGNNQGGDKGSGTRSSLMWNTVEIVRHCKPKYVIWENVKNILSKKHKHNFEKYVRDLKELGYTSYYKVLNAKNYGIPQNRERIYCISILGQHTPYKFPDGWKLNKKLKDILESNVDEKYYINKPFSLVNKGHQAELDIKGQDCIKRVYGTDKIAPTLTTMQGGMREPKIIEKVERTPLKFLNRNQKNVYGDYAFCVDTSQTGGIKEIYLDNSIRIRKLTPKECWRLMGFSDEDFDKAQLIPTSNTQLYKQAGNSIVVNVLEEIFKKTFLIKGGIILWQINQ